MQWRSQPNSDARAQIFQVTHNVTTCLDSGPTFMKAQKIMHIQYNLSRKCTCDNLHLARHYILLFTAAYFTTLA